MVADTTAELLDMADRIGVARKWLQHADTPREHFDIAMTKRAEAVRLGAVECRMSDVGHIVRAKRLAAAEAAAST
jgi:hypothetical protein